MSSTPVEQLTNAQLKEELTTLYGVTDFSDCFEKGDLWAKLAFARDHMPRTQGLRYGQLLHVGNMKNPSGVVTLIHGLGDSASGWKDVGEELARRFPYLHFVLPSAADRSVTINNGAKMPAWYDIHSLMADSLLSGQQDAKGVLQSADYVTSVVHNAMTKFHMPSHRVVYAGFSQGGAVSLAAGLTCEVAPAGIAVLSGYLAAAKELLPRVTNRDTPIQFFHGRQDPVVPFIAAEETKKMLETEAGVKAPIGIHSYDMVHTLVPKELDDLATFIRKVLPDK